MFFLERANGPEVHNAALPSSSKQITFCTRGLWAQNSWQDKLLAFNLTKLVWSLMQQIMPGPIFQEKWTRVSRVFTCQIQVTAVQGIGCKWVTIWPIKLTKKTKKTFTGWGSSINLWVDGWDGTLCRATVVGLGLPIWEWLELNILYVCVCMLFLFSSESESEKVTKKYRVGVRVGWGDQLTCLFLRVEMKTLPL